jgi:superfamily I DNA/RNA helicase
VDAIEEAIETIPALPTPVGEQKDVLALTPRGHAVVLGTAGSGKTTMAVLRALHLSDRTCDHAGKTLLVTYNKSLLAYLEHMLPIGIHDLEVRNYHRFARGYLDSRGEMSYGCIAAPGTRERLIRAALREIRDAADASFPDRPDEFFFSELAWIAQNGHAERDAYLRARRVGRGVALPVAARDAVFDVRDAYVRLRSEAGKRYDWDDLASATRAQLEVDDDDRLYRHVIIDEGQDFSPEMIRSLALAIPQEGSLSFFGDVAQQIYGRAVSWRTAGLKVKKVWEFSKNYRNSPQIASLAMAIATMPYYEDQDEMVAPDEFADAGPPPAVVSFDNATTEVDFVVEQARELGRLGPVGVLCRRIDDAVRIGKQLPEAQRLHGDMIGAWRPEGISYGSIHAAKGYEFQSVIVVGLNADDWPDPMAVAAQGEEEATALDGRLLYVAVSRARQTLILTRTGELSHLMPENDGLWQEE